MNRAAVLCLAAACLVSAAPAANAGPVSTGDYSWGYQFKSDGNPVTVINSGGSQSIITIPGTGGSSNMQTASGKTVDISTPIWTLSDATAAHPQTVSDVPFAIDLKITDKASGISEYVSFGGVLNGTVWNTGSSLTPTFLGPLTQSVDIDHHLYTVSYVSFSSPSGGGILGLDSGKFVFDVKAQHNPEPSSLVLAGIGLPILGLAFRRRKRK